MAELISIDTECNTNGDGGGIECIYLAKCKDLDIAGASYFPLGNDLMDIPWLTATNPWVKVIPSEDNQSYFNQLYSKDTYKVAQESFIKINGATSSHFEAAFGYTQNCCLMIIHVFKDGGIFLSGFDSIWYKGKWNLVKGISNTEVTTIQSTSGSGNIPSGIDITFTSLTDGFAIPILGNVLNNLLNIETVTFPAPSVFNNITGTLVNTPASSANGGGHLSLSTAVYLNTTPNTYIPFITYPINLLDIFCGAAANGASSIVISTTAITLWGQTTDIDTIPITSLGGIINSINGVVCPIVIPPTIAITPLAGTIVSAPTYTLGQCPSSNSLLNITNTVILLDAGGTLEFPITFPYDLIQYCGSELNANYITLKSEIVTSCGTDIDTLQVPVVRDVNGVVTSINGVACPITELPTVALVLNGTQLLVDWYDGGDAGAVRSLVISNGTNSITLDSTVASIDLGAILYGIESAGGTYQNYTVSAEITNSVGTDSDSRTCEVITRPWSGGRFIHTVNSITMPFPLVSGLTLTGAAITDLVLDVTLWKSIQIRFKSYRNPFGYPIGTFEANYTSRIYDSINGINIALNLLDIYCGGEHVTGDDVKVQAVPISGGVEGTFYEETVMVTVDANNLITSINGITC